MSDQKPDAQGQTPDASNTAPNLRMPCVDSQGQAALVREKREAELSAGAKPTVAEWIEHALAFLRSIDMDTTAAEDDQSDAIHALEEALAALGAVPQVPQPVDVEAMRKALLAADAELYQTYGETPRLKPLFAQIDAALSRVSGETGKDQK